MTPWLDKSVLEMKHFFSCFAVNPPIQVDDGKNTVRGKKEKKGKKKKLTKDKIGTPTNFRHVGHVGWDPNTGFDVSYSVFTLPKSRTACFLPGIVLENLAENFAYFLFNNR